MKWRCLFLWIRLIFVTLKVFCFVWKLKEALRNKARAFLSHSTFLKSLLMNTGGTYTTQGFGRQAEPCNDDWSTNSNPESHHAKSLLNVFFKTGSGVWSRYLRVWFKCSFSFFFPIKLSQSPPCELTLLSYRKSNCVVYRNRISRQ